MGKIRLEMVKNVIFPAVIRYFHLNPRNTNPRRGCCGQGVM